MKEEKMDRVRFNAWLPAALLLVVAAVSPDALGANAVVNGDFEQGLSGWWGDAVGKKTASVAPDGSAGGGSSLRLASDWVCQDKRPVSGGRNCRISMRIRSEGADPGSVYVQLSFRGGGLGPKWYGPRLLDLGGRSEPVVLATGGTHGWRRFEVVVSTPAKASEVLVYLRKRGAAGVAFFDDVSVEPTDAPASTPASIRRDELSAQWLAAPGGSARALAAGGASGSFALAQGGKAKCRIYVADRDDLVSLNAAVELARYLERATGASFAPLAHEKAVPAGPCIVVGCGDAVVKALKPDIPFGRLGRDGFAVRTVGRHLVIAGATPRGTMYGVNWFLERMVGVKWLAPDFTVVPKKPTLAVSALRETQVPRFKYREVFSSEGHDDAYAAHNLLNGRSHGRSYRPSAPEIDDWESWWTAKGGDANFWDLLGDKLKAHPEWKAGGQVAMMNGDIRQAMADEIVARLRRLDDYRSVAFNIHDMDWGWDMDAESRKFAERHGGVPSAPRLDMVADIAGRVRAKLPEARFTFNPYHWSFTPPTGMTVPDYVIPFPMTIHVDYSAPLCGAPNKKLAEDLVGWTKISKQVLVWDHTVNFFGFLQPTPNLYPICESIKWLSTLDPVTGYFAEDSWMTPGAEHAALRTWVIAHLLWDPGRDPRALVREFVDGYYGPAGKYIMDYIDLSHASMARTHDTFREKTTAQNRYVNLDFVMEADRLFAQAHEAAKGSPDYLRHVETTRMAVDCPALLRRAEFEAEARRRGLKWSADTPRRAVRLFANCEAAKVREYVQGGSVGELKELVAIERRAPEVPDLAKGLPESDWIDFQDLSFTRYGAKIVADAAASDGAAIRIDGKSSVWAAQFRRYKLPEEGKWDLYVSVRIDPKEGVPDAAPAVRIGLSPPMGRFNAGTSGELRDGAYHWIKVPGCPTTYAQEDEHLVYVQPCAGQSAAVYVDRVLAVRGKSGQ